MSFWGPKIENPGVFFVISGGLKKIATISLLCILLFSLFGYRLLIASLLDMADRDMDARLNQSAYDESQLISFKVPMTRLSYYNPSEQWERIDGSIEIGNVFYKYVKRRIVDDSLEVLCIPNSTATKLQVMKRQASHPAANKIPAQEPYVFTAPCVAAASPCKELTRIYFYSVFIPSHCRITEERPPSTPLV